MGGTSVNSPTEQVIPWYIKKIVNNPCQVMALSMGSACGMVFLLLIFMVTGLIEFELDTDPNSFNVKFDNMADRYDAQRAIKLKTSVRGPAAFSFAKDEKAALEKMMLNETYVSVDNDAFAFYYEVKNGKDHIPDGGAGGNIFDVENLKEIIAFENSLLKMERYKTYCYRDNNIRSNTCKGYSLSPRMLGYSTSKSIQSMNLPFQSCCECDGNVTVGKNAPCAPKTAIPICVYNSTNFPQAIIPYMDGDGDGVGGSFTNNDLKSVLNSLANTLSCKIDEMPSNAAAFKFFFEKKYSTSNPTTSCSRSVLPLTYWMNKKERDDFYNSLSPKLSNEERDAKINEFMNAYWKKFDADLQYYVIKEIKPMVEAHNAKESTKVRISFFGPWIISDEIVSGILGAAQFVAFAIVIVLLYIIYHTESIFLGVLGQLHIIISFPVTWFIYRCIFQFKYMGMLNFISMFVIIGIGADVCITLLNR